MRAKVGLQRIRYYYHVIDHHPCHEVVQSREGSNLSSFPQDPAHSDSEQGLDKEHSGVAKLGGK